MYPRFWEVTSNESRRTWMILIRSNNGKPVLTILSGLNIWNDRFFLLCLFTSSSQIVSETRIHAHTTHTIMHNGISPGLYLRAAVLMINAPSVGKLFHRRKTRRGEDTWNISLRPFLIIIIIIISSLLPYLSCLRMLDLLARGRGWHFKEDFTREKWTRTKIEIDTFY